MIQLSCENEICIYQKSGKCILDSVRLDIQGNCIDCIYINMEEDVMNNLKGKMLSGI